MLDFVVRVFRVWMNVLLWLLLIGCAIGGFVVFGIFFGGWGFNAGYAFLGLFLGGFIGLITVILSGGLIANFLNMVDNINKQTKLQKQLLIHFGLSENIIDEIIGSRDNEKQEKPVEQQISEIQSEKNINQNELKIIRLTSKFGSGIALDVSIDDNEKFFIKNGEEKIINISNGKHIIKVFRDNDYDKQEFEINNNGKIFSILIGPPIKIKEI